MNAYPELRSGRFALIADFEDSKQMEIVQVISVSPVAHCALSTRGGRKETGLGSLSFTAGSKDDVVVIANKGGEDWYLKRDWRAYDLLMMSVFSPEDSLSLNVSIRGGSSGESSTIFTSVPLDRGWNVLRFDLGEVGERVALDDIREIRLGVTDLSKTVTLTIDDIVLTGYRVAVFGDPNATSGGLYVQQVGRHLRIGAGGKFELVVGNGQIRGWYNLVSDPNRLRNLLYESTLGPNPVIVGGPADENGFSGLGKTVVASHRIVEANPVRVILQCQWRFVDDSLHARGGLDAAPFQRWRYTIYPTGQVYVLIETTSKTDDGWSPQLGLSVSLASSQRHGIETLIPQMDREEDDADVPMFAMLSNPTASSELLFVPDLISKTLRFVENVSEDGRLVSITALDDRAATPVKRWISHLVLSNEKNSSSDTVRLRSQDASGVRSVVQIERGAPVQLEDGSIRSDGFNRVEGCYAIVPDAGRIRVLLDGGVHAIFSPAFCIPGEAGREAWVYVDHLIFEPVVRNDAGQLLFQLPGVVDKRSEVEVLFRRTSNPSP